MWTTSGLLLSYRHDDGHDDYGDDDGHDDYGDDDGHDDYGDDYDRIECTLDSVTSCHRLNDNRRIVDLWWTIYFNYIWSI